jgi:hypothetical protein
VSTFTLYSSETCDVNAVPASNYIGKFTDIVLFNESHAFGFHQPNNQDKDCLVMFELNSFISWEIIDHEAMYYRSGYHIRLDKVKMTLSYLKNLTEVVIMNNPQDAAYRQKLSCIVDFPVHDFIMLGHYDLLVCGLEGNISLNNYDDHEDIKVNETLRFKLNFEEREMLSFVRKTESENFVIFATHKQGKFNRLLIYKYDNNTLEYATEWSMGEATKGVDSEKLLHSIEANLVDPMTKDAIVVGIEQGYGAGLRVWRLSGEG